MVIWLIGMSGAGKTVIGRHLYEMWKAEAANTVFVDGDEIRELFKHNQRPDAYTIEGRRVNAERITSVCAWLDRQGINVVCCVLSLFPDMREQNHKLFSGYLEVYISVPMDVLRRRDDKNLYGPAMRGEISNVVGVDLPFTPPAAPDMVIDNGADGADLRSFAARILGKALAR